MRNYTLVAAAAAAAAAVVAAAVLGFFLHGQVLRTSSDSATKVKVKVAWRDYQC